MTTVNQVVEKVSNSGRGPLFSSNAAIARPLFGHILSIYCATFSLNCVTASSWNWSLFFFSFLIHIVLLCDSSVLRWAKNADSTTWNEQKETLINSLVEWWVKMRLKSPGKNKKEKRNPNRSVPKTTKNNPECKVRKWGTLENRHRRPTERGNTPKYWVHKGLIKDGGN